MYSFPCHWHLDPRRASPFAGNEMSLCMPKSKMRGQLCQLAWSWHAARKHLSLYAGLGFPSLASWLFLCTDTALCVKAECTMVRQQQNKLTVSMHSHTLLCVSFAGISHAKEEGFNWGDKTQSQSIQAHMHTSCTGEVSYSNFNLKLFLFKVQEKCNLLESTTKSVCTYSYSTENSHSMDIKCPWGEWNIPRA